MIAIIEYNAGNATSVQHAVNRLGYPSMITNNPADIRSADKVIFPGVGEAASAMAFLRDTGLDEVITSLKQPVLGICLGQQLLCTHSEEGDTRCLGVFTAEVKKFPATDIVPHMGWNTICDLKSPLFAGIRENSHVYFVHGYYCTIIEETIAVSDYIIPFSAAIRKDNFYATQFHPEKSAGTGEQLLRNFLQL